ncbi:hypothetical protein R3P38DRAFT_3233607 [Favolaschia claudopus]|uniref:NAD(P)-binding protein n=1 Tax=Favolaschia claudopus TaxID=2862362 RepID=A0AAV9ZHK1_9AGAR
MSPPEFSFTTTAEEVAAAFANEITGKMVLLITGTSIGGIGFEAARVIAKHANLVIITGYNGERQATQMICRKLLLRKKSPLLTFALSFSTSSLTAVRQAAAEGQRLSRPIHVLIHNAAAPIGPFKLTVDHLDTQMATSHFGPFLFTKLISPRLLAAETTSYTPRVILSQVPRTHFARA